MCECMCKKYIHVSIDVGKVQLPANRAVCKLTARRARGLNQTHGLLHRIALAGVHCTGPDNNVTIHYSTVFCVHTGGANDSRGRKSLSMTGGRGV